MLTIKPFKAIRATPEKAAHVISRTYQDYGTEELEAQLKFNPFSFLHILNPGYKYSHEITGEERFNLVRNRFLEFREENHLMKEDAPAFYLYENKDPHHEYTGIIAAASVEDYQQNRIRKHEDTLSHKEILFKDYLKIVGFNAEPVLLTYRDDKSIEFIYFELALWNEETHEIIITIMCATHFLGE